MYCNTDHCRPGEIFDATFRFQAHTLTVYMKYAYRILRQSRNDESEEKRGGTLVGRYLQHPN